MALEEVVVVLASGLVGVFKLTVLPPLAVGMGKASVADGEQLVQLPPEQGHVDPKLFTHVAEFGTRVQAKPDAPDDVQIRS